MTEKICPRCGIRCGMNDTNCPTDNGALAVRGDSGDPFMDLVIDGRLKMERYLGAGGMGHVYIARQLDATQREVAVKFIRAELTAQKEDEKRFFREIRILASAAHPNVVSVFFSGHAEVTGQKIPYFAMELLDGKPLDELIGKGKRLEIRRSCKIAIDMLHGLHALHEAGIIHRDLKPANVLLMESRGDQVKILDFGLAKPIAHDQEETAVTVGNVVMGTPAYMSPEQMLGWDLDDRSDLYSGGMILYELVTGYRPHRNNMGVIPSPSEAFPELHLPEGLCELVASMVAMDRDKRPATARQARGTLESILAELNGISKPIAAAADLAHGETVAVDGVLATPSPTAFVPPAPPVRSPAFTEAAVGQDDPAMPGQPDRTQVTPGYGEHQETQAPGAGGMPQPLQQPPQQPQHAQSAEWETQGSWTPQQPPLQPGTPTPLQQSMALSFEQTLKQRNRTLFIGAMIAGVVLVVVLAGYQILVNNKLGQAGQQSAQEEEPRPTVESAAPVAALDAAVQPPDVTVNTTVEDVVPPQADIPPITDVVPGPDTDDSRSVDTAPTVDVTPEPDNRRAEVATDSVSTADHRKTHGKDHKHHGASDDRKDDKKDDKKDDRKDDHKDDKNGGGTQAVEDKKDPGKVDSGEVKKDGEDSGTKDDPTAESDKKDDGKTEPPVEDPESSILESD